MTDLDALEKKVQDLAVGVVGLSGAMREVGRALREDIDTLQTEIENQRRLAKYARRTWFEVMAYIFFTGLLVSDAARQYCAPSNTMRESVFPRACDTVFWTTDHGGGWEWRVLGLVILVILLFWLGRRSQVPSDLFEDAIQSKTEPRFLFKHLLKNRRRS